MNRRKFFGAVTAAVVAALAPESSMTGVSLHAHGKGPGYIAARYGRGLREHSWWRPNVGAATFPTDMRQLEARTLASLQTAWKECLSYKTGDTLIIDEHAVEIITSHRSKRS